MSERPPEPLLVCGRRMHDLRCELAPRQDRGSLPQQNLPHPRFTVSKGEERQSSTEMTGTYVGDGDHEDRETSEERATPVVRQLCEELCGEERERCPHDVAWNTGRW